MRSFFFFFVVVVFCFLHFCVVLHLVSNTGTAFHSKRTSMFRFCQRDPLYLAPPPRASIQPSTMMMMTVTRKQKRGRLTFPIKDIDVEQFRAHSNGWRRGTEFFFGGSYHSLLCVDLLTSHLVVV